MKVYLQNADGNEIELTVTQPDPEDGTFVILFGTGSEWLRIVPQVPSETK